jgi:hypothetical protein
MNYFADLDAFIAGLHPHLAGLDSIQLLSVAVVAWLGTRAIAGRRSDEDEPAGPRITVREATRLAAKIRRKK